MSDTNPPPSWPKPSKPFDDEVHRKLKNLAHASRKKRHEHLVVDTRSPAYVRIPFPEVPVPDAPSPFTNYWPGKQRRVDLGYVHRICELLTIVAPTEDSRIKDDTMCLIQLPGWVLKEARALAEDLRRDVIAQCEYCGDGGWVPGPVMNTPWGPEQSKAVPCQCAAGAREAERQE